MSTSKSNFILKPYLKTSSQTLKGMFQVGKMVAMKAFGVMKDRDLFDPFFILVFGYFWPFTAEFYVVGSF